MRKGTIAALLLLLAFVASSCASYRIISFEDQGDVKVTQFETLKTTNYLFFATVEHQFWLCQDAGNTLACERRCGGETDLTRPEGTLGTGISNTR